MNILAYDPFLSSDNVLLSELRAELVDLDTLLSRSDIVSCHVPGSPKTDGLINRDRQAKMKPTAFFINTARGQVVIEDDLIDALTSGKIAGAALDVRTTEPPTDSRFNGLKNVLLTPHIAAFTTEAQNRVTRAVCGDIERLLDGKPAANAATSFALPRNRS
jgi:phosphoglycerate dehydrogenase-like enzyme